MKLLIKMISCKELIDLALFSDIWRKGQIGRISLKNFLIDLKMNWMRVIDFYCVC